MRGRAVAVGVVVGVVAVLGGGCATRTVALPDAGSLTAPAFPDQPDDPGESPQLAALVERDESGLPPPPRADGAALVQLVPLLAEAYPGVTEAVRISVYEESAFFTVVDPANDAVELSANWSSGDDELNLLGPDARDDEAFPLAAVDPTVPLAVADGIHRRFPSLSVVSYDLRRGLSYDFGLAWYLEVNDASGNRATVFVDPGGEVIAVDPA